MLPLSTCNIIPFNVVKFVKERFWAINAKFIYFCDVERKTFFVDILLPLPVPGMFTYRVPYAMNDDIKRGQRVTVQFGKKRVYAGVVYKIHEKPPGKGLPKYILDILDDTPLVNDIQFEFWDWISDYYMSYYGDVLNAALPSSFKLASESKIMLADGFVPDNKYLTDTEYKITEALLQKKRLTIDEVSKIVGFKKVLPILKSMIENRALVMEEELKEGYKPKRQKFVRLAGEYLHEEKLQQLMDELGKRAHKQLEVVMNFISLTGFPLDETKNVKSSELLIKSGASQGVLKVLEEKGVFVTFEKNVSRFETAASRGNVSDIVLSEMQTEALRRIEISMKSHLTVLLHGVTSSGKTELYIKLIDKTLKEGRQVLYLLPEIALTSQIIGRLQKYFGDEVGIYHSRYNANERAEVWYNLLGKTEKTGHRQYKIILGPRSAMFLPFSNLGLIIVDEEHDSSYKQFDPAPRYNARDSAIYLATLHNAKVILGSATPSIESFYNAKRGKYGLVTLNERFGGIKMPEIIVVNMKEQQRRRMIKSHFSSVLLDHVKAALKDGKQVILFQNRRGFSSRIECEQCNWIPGCKYCDVTLTYHKNSELLKCHYCGYSMRVPAVCHNCGSPGLVMKGFGTEKVEEELGLLLPDAKIDRMDLDSTRTKNAFHRILHDFETGKTNVLTGTQMVTKGLDFGNVRVVGILNADNMLSFPDFRAHERSFQMMEQVSGRAGRKEKRGTVIIQTWQIDHPVIRQVVSHDYEGMYNDQLAERKKFFYPPFYRLINIKLKHARPEIVNEGATILAKDMRTVFGKLVYGPEYPMVSRIKNKYIKQILLKIPRNANLKKQKDMLSEVILRFQSIPEYKSLRIQVDVDPQ
jgi:primosomal protein N' (replication factor Y)